MPKSMSFATSEPSALPDEEDVVGLDIAMNDADRVDRGDRARDLLADRRDTIGVEHAALRDERAKVLADRAAP